MKSDWTRRMGFGGETGEIAFDGKVPFTVPGVALTAGGKTRIVLEAK